MKKKLIIGIAVLNVLTARAQCIADEANIYTFEVNNVLFEVVKENKTWADAAGCAVERGGKLAEIYSKAMQDTIYYYVKQAGIIAANTKAPDGGNASYIWLGGNDIRSEGNWFWDGKDMGSFYQFWQGTVNGTAINNAYSNWGNEPDNFNGQNGLGLAITNWPFGLAGQWNDVKENNQLYYIIEYPMMIKTSLPELPLSTLRIYPNPAGDFLTLKNASAPNAPYTIVDIAGVVILSGYLSQEETQLDIHALKPGFYTVSVDGSNSRLIKH